MSQIFVNKVHSNVDKGLGLVEKTKFWYANTPLIRNPYLPLSMIGLSALYPSPSPPQVNLDSIFEKCHTAVANHEWYPQGERDSATITHRALGGEHQ